MDQSCSRMFELDVEEVSVSDVFREIYSRVNVLPAPRSLVEIGFAEQEIDWLRRWLSRLSQETISEKQGAYQGWTDEYQWRILWRAAVAVALLVVGCERCRDTSGEHSVWPSFNEELKCNPWLKQEYLSSNNQPNEDFKKDIDNACRLLDLRHGLDFDETQKYRTTAKLQFGFTFRGAKKRLAEWLVGFGTPVAIQHLLNGTLESESFKSLWIALRQYRQDKISEDKVRVVAKGNPWIKEHWMETLLREAKARIENLGLGTDASDLHGQMEDAECSQLVDRVWMEWSTGKDPSLFFRIDTESLESMLEETDYRKICFLVDGEQVGYWTNEDRKTTFRIQPAANASNLFPQFLEIRSDNDKVISQVQFPSLGLDKDIIVFDLDSKDLIYSETSCLNQLHRHAFLSRDSFTVEGCRIGQRFGKVAVRIEPPLSDNIRVRCGEFMLWQPVKGPTEKESVTAFVTTDSLIEIGTRAFLLVDGIPDEAKEVSLLVGDEAFECDKVNGRWTTRREVSVPSAFALKHTRLRVRYLTDEIARTMTPQMHCQLIGCILLSTTTPRGKLLKKGDYVDSSWSGILKFFAPEKEEASTIIEGNRILGRPSHGRVRIENLLGLGGLLSSRNGTECSDFGIKTRNREMKLKFIPPLMGQSAQVRFCSDHDYTPEDQLVLWRKTQKNGYGWSTMNLLVPERRKRQRFWDIEWPDGMKVDDIIAAAVVCREAHIGTTWFSDLTRIPTDSVSAWETFFAALRWLKYPILDADLDSLIRLLVWDHPIEFLGVWKGNKGLPDYLGFRPSENGEDTVIRHFFWNDFPTNHAHHAFRALEGNSRRYSWSERIERSGELSLPLMWLAIKECVEKNGLQALRCYYDAEFSLLNLKQDQKKEDWRARRAAHDVAELIGFSSEGLDSLLKRRYETLQRKETPSPQDGGALQLLGENGKGRRYVASWILSEIRNRYDQQ